MTVIAGYVLALLALLTLGLHVSGALFVSALILDGFLHGSLVRMIGNIAWSTLNDYLLVSIPIFILLGEILKNSGVTERIYESLAAWTERMPGGLLHTNIVACTLFAATSGSSVATAATIGSISVPVMAARGYNERLVLGSIAAGGTLGILIPPSIAMVIYGAMTGVSVAQLFLAGIVPGLLLAVMMMLVTGVISVWTRSGSRIVRPELTFVRRLKLLFELMPLLGIFVLIMGSIYMGFATPTEAASLGVVGALFIAALYGRLTIKMLHRAFVASLTTTGMVLLVILAAVLLNFVLSLAGIPQELSRSIADLNLSPTATIYALFVFFLVLGCVLEGLAMMITTVGIVLPMVIALGIDPLWFGIFMVLMMELALITPPLGLNLYVVQSIRQKKEGSIHDVFIGVLPYIVVMVLFVVLLIHFPNLALWLPSTM